MTTDSFDALFGKREQSFSPKNSNRDTNAYSPSFKDGKNNVYTSLIRFIPFWSTPKECIRSKSVCWLGNIATGLSNPSKRPIDIPGKDEYNPISDLYWNLVKSGNQSYKDFAYKVMGLNEQHTALIQVLNDENHPEYVGKIMVFRFGKTLYEKLATETTGTSYTEGQDPFELFGGKNFLLSITDKGGNNNYDKCQFVEDSVYKQNSNASSVLCPTKDANGNITAWNYLTRTPESMKAFAEYLEAGPNLEDYAAKPWDDATREYVDSCMKLIETYLQTGVIPSKVPETAVAAPQAPTFGVQQPAAAQAFNPAQASQPSAIFGAVAPQAPQTPVAPQVPQAPHVPSAPQIPSAPQVPQAPQMPTAPQGVASSTVELPSVAQQPAAPSGDAREQKYAGVDVAQLADLTQF